MDQIRIFQISEILCLLTGILVINKIKKSVFFFFVPYMVIVVFVDIIANYLPLKINGSNQWLFNLYLPIQNLFFSFVFYFSLNRRSAKNLVIIGLVLFLLFYFSNLFFIQGFWEFNNYSFVFTAIFMIIYSGVSLLQMAKSDTSKSLYRNPLFWVSASCLIFFTGFATFFAVYFYYKTSAQAFTQMQTLYHIMTRYIITIHYILLIFALVFAIQREQV